MKVVALLPKDDEGQYENQLLSTYNALGLREYFDNSEHDLQVITSDEELDNHLDDVEVVISSPFLPLYVTKERMEKAPNLKLSITAGVGSDHVDLKAAQENDVSVTEVTNSNTVSVAEHAVMTILVLLRNYQEGHRQAREGEWNLPLVGNHAYDLEGKTVGIYGFGRIGHLLAERLAPFGVDIIHYDPMNEEDSELSKYVPVEKLLEDSDIISIHSPLTDSTRGLFNKEFISKMKDDAYLVNCARGNIVEKDDLVKALENDELRAYGGDVWYPQPASADHPWRSLPSERNAMVPHYSGMTIDAQRRIEKGVKELLDSYINDEPYRDEYIIVDGDNVSASYTAGE